MFHFATLFDKNYLRRGVCLFNSLEETMTSDFHLYVLALDDYVIKYFNNYPNPRLTIIELTNLENYFPELVIAKKNRTLIEYYFTLSPILPLYILENFKNCQRITTLDADIYFFSSPESIFKYYNDESILITPHDFTPELLHLLINGKYNVSFQSFPNTKNGKAVLKDWKVKCLIWCKDTLDEKTGNYADQKYLDDWQNEFKNIEIINLKTCGRAPWNIAKTNLTYTKGLPCINNEFLIYYHFHHLRIFENYITHGLEHYGIFYIKKPLQIVYSIYIRSLLKIKIGSHNDTGTIRIIKPIEKTILHQFWKNDIGAIMFFNRIVFYNLSTIKKTINKIRLKINGKINRPENIYR